MEMLEREWTDDEIRDLMGGNLLRVMDEVDAVRDSLVNDVPSTAVWEKRTDLPAAWGGRDNAYYPRDVVDAAWKALPVHDEL